jgi:hypothetical protein
VLLVLVLVAVATFVLVGRRNKRLQAERAAAELAPVKKLAFEDVTALGEELTNLDLELAGRPMVGGENADYQRALDAYEAAKTAGDAIQRPEDLKHVAEILEDGRYAIACVQARLAGQPVPARLPPCFFNPQHGPSAENVDWAPPGGVPRSVPACAADAERVRAGAEPDVRKVPVGAGRAPYWQGGRGYGPYAQGYFSPFAMSGLLPGLFLGSLLSGGFGGGDGSYSDGYQDGADSGDGGGDSGDSGDGGDSGGGDDGGGYDSAGGDYGDGGGYDGGGDFGGGDFGGGDFGGGDFGGGDFGGF